MTTFGFSRVSDYELRGRRTKAAWIDVVILAVVGFALIALLGDSQTIRAYSVINGRHFHSTSHVRSMSGTGALVWAGAALVYYFTFEFLWGQTPGKWVMRVRVMTVSGGRPDVRAIFLRTVGRIVDFLPFWYLGGWLFMRGQHRPLQRIGDRLAGTTVEMLQP